MTSYSGRRLRNYVGAKLWAKAEFRNVLNHYPGHSGDARGGDKWPIELARASASVMKHELNGAYVMFVGKHVADAFGIHSEFNQYFIANAFHCWSQGGVGGFFEFQVIPHPSGVNRWWNDRKNRATARRFFKSLRASLRG